MTDFPVLCSVVQHLDPFDKTLYPATPLDAELAKPRIPMWHSDDDGRFVVSAVEIIDGSPVAVPLHLSRDWRPVMVRQGMVLLVRAADCGGDCYCAGEFTVPPSPRPAT